MSTCETVRIKSTHPKSQGPFVEINKTDFDKTKHQLFEPGKPPPVGGGNDAPKFGSPQAEKLAIESGLSASQIAAIEGTGAGGNITVADVKNAVDALTIDAEAKELAEDAGLDYSSIKGTGENGLITVADVEKAIDEMEEE